MASAPPTRAETPAGLPRTLRPVSQALRPARGGTVPASAFLPCAVLAEPAVTPPQAAQDPASPAARLAAFWGGVVGDRRGRVRIRLAELASPGPPAPVPSPPHPPVPAPVTAPAREVPDAVPPTAAPPPGDPPPGDPPAAPTGGERPLATRVVRTRATPAGPRRPAPDPGGAP